MDRAAAIKDPFLEVTFGESDLLCIGRLKLHTEKPRTH